MFENSRGLTFSQFENFNDTQYVIRYECDQIPDLEIFEDSLTGKIEYLFQGQEATSIESALMMYDAIDYFSDEIY